MNGYHFTDEVRRILAGARQEAHRLRHEFVGTEHVLLAILGSEPSVAVDLLRALDVDLDGIRATILSVIKEGKDDRPVSADLPYTSRAKKLLELAMVEARELGDGYVGSEHLLLGVLREEKGIAAQVLTKLGVQEEALRVEALRHREAPAQGAPSPGDLPQVVFVGRRGNAGTAAAAAAGAIPPRIRGRAVARRTGGLGRAMYAALSTGIVALGVLHLAATPVMFPDASPGAISYVGTGLLLLLVGALNFLNQSDGGSRGLRLTAVTSNVVLTAFVAMAGRVDNAHPVILGVIVLLMAATTVLSASFRSSPTLP